MVLGFWPRGETSHAMQPPHIKPDNPAYSTMSAAYDKERHGRSLAAAVAGAGGGRRIRQLHIGSGKPAADAAGHQPPGQAHGRAARTAAHRARPPYPAHERGPSDGRDG